MAWRFSRSSQIRMLGPCSSQPHPRLRHGSLYAPALYKSTRLLLETNSWQIHEKLQLPLAKTYAYSPDPGNPVGAEYILEERVRGIPLARVWYSWPRKSKIALITQLVEFEAQLMSVCFQQHGCIYYKKDLEEKGIFPQALEAKALLSAGPGKTLSSTNEFALGPLTRTILWQNKRATMKLDRGPCKLSNRSQSLILN